MADSATCGQSLMLNETKKLMDMATDPLSAVMDTLEEMYDKIKEFASALMNAFKALVRAVKEIISAVATVSLRCTSSCYREIVKKLDARRLAKGKSYQLLRRYS